MRRRDLLKSSLCALLPVGFLGMRRKTEHLDLSEEGLEGCCLLLECDDVGVYKKRWRELDLYNTKTGYGVLSAIQSSHHPFNVLRVFLITDKGKICVYDSPIRVGCGHSFHIHIRNRCMKLVRWYRYVPTEEIIQCQ